MIALAISLSLMESTLYPFLFPLSRKRPFSLSLFLSMNTEALFEALTMIDDVRILCSSSFAISFSPSSFPLFLSF